MRKLAVAALTLLPLLALGSAYAVRDVAPLDRLVGPGSLLERVLARTPFSDKVLCVRLPRAPVAFGTLDEQALKEWIRPLRYATNPRHLAVVDGPEGHDALRQRFVPSPRGSTRVIASINLPPARTYEVEQSVMFERGFQWGGEVESGKFGFGFAGGSAPTGGKLADDGFSARLIWKGDGDGEASVGVYLYSSDRTQNLPYGDEFVVPRFAIPVGEWFRVRMRLTANSDHGARDGSIRIWIDDDVLFERNGIGWQSAGEGLPTIDQVLYSSFHGGNTEQWSPEGEVHARFADVCVHEERPDGQGS